MNDATVISICILISAAAAAAMVYLASYFKDKETQDLKNKTKNND